MKTFFTVFMALFIAMFASAQSVFVVQNDTSSSAYLTLQAAVDAAIPGDYIYIPGGNFTIGDLQIDKQLHIIGAGHYPDSTQATGRTNLAGNIIFNTGADHSTLQGIYLENDISFGKDIDHGVVSNVFISRCNVNKLYFTYKGSPSTNCGASNVYVKDCIIRGDLSGGYSYGHVVENTILSGCLNYISGNFQFRNCIFTNMSYYLLYNVSSTLFSNCIIPSAGYLIWSNPAKCTFNNCVMNNYWGGRTEANFYDCLYLEDVKTVFKDVPEYKFDYKYDFHLNDSTIANTAGTNGTQCGIYGGENPFKEGGVPINPHIQFKKIPNSTDSQGKLNIEVRVKAQEN
ncbi:MAG: hypothetical protein PHH37_15815 [Paludibacter sp.]|nr:hypothetical protein [Paludibacter sp.]